MTAKPNALRYDDEGLGVPLVFLHGFPLERSVWHKQMEALRSSYRIIAPDLSGLGESEATAGPVSMDTYAADVRAVLTKLTTAKAVLIGHSMGGYVALAFARRFPQLLRGLVLVSTRAGPDSADAAAGRRAMAEKVKADGVHVAVEAVAPKMLAARNLDPRMAGEVRALMASAKPAGVIAALLGMAERPDARPHLAALAMPVLVVTGADDTLIPPAESEAITQAIPGAQLNVIPHAGHLVAFEQPDAFNRILTEWLRDYVTFDVRRK
jgi:pimeloyl-ACP methyl ester carboxylesterase